MIIRAQLIGRKGSWSRRNSYNQLFTMHGTTMISSP